MAASAGETNQATEHVSAVIQDVADGAVRQTQNVEQGSIAVHELKSGVQSAAENSEIWNVVNIEEQFSVSRQQYVGPKGYQGALECYDEAARDGIAAILHI